jgi:hypothetical protein
MGSYQAPGRKPEAVMMIQTSASGLAAAIAGDSASARGGWPSLAAFIGLLPALASAFALKLARVPPAS